MKTWRSLLVAVLFFGAVGSTIGQTTPSEGPTPKASPTASLSSRSRSAPSSPAYSLAPYQQRLANAKSVKVMTSILGVELGSTLESAHKKLDKQCDSKHRPKEEKEEDTKEGDQKVLWQLAGTDYSFVFVKADDKGRITYVSGFLRPGKEIPFKKIGETEKAPLQDTNTIAWDVLRPKRPLCRVVASGANRKAKSVMLFVVKRPGLYSGSSSPD